MQPRPQIELSVARTSVPPALALALLTAVTWVSGRDARADASDPRVWTLAPSGDPYTDQQAINAILAIVAPGDTIRFQAGTFYASLDIKDKHDLTIEGTGTPQGMDRCDFEAGPVEPGGTRIESKAVAAWPAECMVDCFDLTKPVMPVTPSSIGWIASNPCVPPPAASTVGYGATLSISGSTNITVKNLTLLNTYAGQNICHPGGFALHDFWSSHVVNITSSEQVTFDSCLISGLGKAPFQVYYGKQSYYDSTPAENPDVTIRSSKISGWYFLVGTFLDDIYAYDSLFCATKMDVTPFCDQHALIYSAYSNNTFVNCRFVNDEKNKPYCKTFQPPYDNRPFLSGTACESAICGVAGYPPCDNSGLRLIPHGHTIAVMGHTEAEVGAWMLAHPNFCGMKLLLSGDYPSALPDFLDTGCPGLLVGVPGGPLCRPIALAKFPDPPPIALESGSCHALLPDLGDAATIRANWGPGFTISQTPEAGTVLSCGVTPVSLAIADLLTGRTHQVDMRQVVNVDDPVTLIAPIDTAVECDADRSPAATGDAKASAPCSAPTVTFSDSVVPGSYPQARVITRTWTAANRCGFSASKDQIISVVDLTAPQVTCPEPVLNAASDGYVLGVATATDNCDPRVTITQDPSPGTPLAPGVHTVSAVATDDAGNQTPCGSSLVVPAIADATTQEEEPPDDPPAAAPPAPSTEGDTGGCGCSATGGGPAAVLAAFALLALGLARMRRAQRPVAGTGQR